MFAETQNPIILLSFVKIDGTPDDSPIKDILDNLESFSYEEDATAAGQCTLYLANPNGVFDNDERLSGKSRYLAIKWGYPNYLSPTKLVKIRQLAPEYLASGGAKMEVLCFDVAAKAGDVSNPQNFGRIATSEIAKKVAKNHNLACICPDESNDVRKTPYIQPAKMTDLQFIKALARKRGWICFVDGKTLYYGPERFQDAPALLAVYGDADFSKSYSGAPIVMQSFKPQMDAGRIKHTKLLAIDPNLKAVVAAKMNGPQAQGTRPERASLGSEATVSFAANTIEVKDLFPEEAEAQAHKQKGSAEGSASQIKEDAAAAQFDKTKKEAQAHAVFAPGNPDIRVLRVLDIQGVAVTHAGNWMVTNCVHSISATQGYQVETTLKRPGQNTVEGAAAADPLKNTNTKSAADNKGGTGEATGVPYFKTDFKTGQTSVGTRP